MGDSRKLEFLWSKIQEARDSFAKLKSIKSVGATTTITIRPHRCSCSSTSLPALGYWQDEYALRQLALDALVFVLACFGVIARYCCRYRHWLKAALEFTNSFEVPNLRFSAPNHSFVTILTRQPGIFWQRSNKCFEPKLVVRLRWRSHDLALRRSVQLL